MYPSHRELCWNQDYLHVTVRRAFYSEGWDNMKAQQEAFLNNVQTVINNQIIGDRLNKWQFTVPIEKEKDGERNVIGKKITEYKDLYCD